MASPKTPPAGQQTKRVCLGRIASAHGVKGLVKLLPYGEDVSLLETLGPLYTAQDGPQTLKIKIHNTAGKNVIAAVEGCADRDQAEKLRGTELWVDRAALPEIEDEDEFYIEDLIGLEVRNEKGVRIGKVSAVENFGGGDLLDVKPDGGQSAYVQFRSEFVGDINLNEGYLVLTEDGLAVLE